MEDFWYLFHGWLAAKDFRHASFSTAMEWLIFFVTRSYRYRNTNICVLPAIFNYDTPFSYGHIPHGFQLGNTMNWIFFCFAFTSKHILIPFRNELNYSLTASWLLQFFNILFLRLTNINSYLLTFCFSQSEGNHWKKHVSL